MCLSGKSMTACAIIAIVVLVGVQGSADASDGMSPALETIALSIGIIGPAIPFAAADISYGVRGRWLPPVWAGFQTGLGLIDVAAGISLIAKNEGSRPTGFGIAALTLGAWFTTHGLLSLFRREKNPQPKAAFIVPQVAVVPLEGGGFTSLRWRLTL